MNESRFRPYIEGLRALAIFLVLLFHAGLPVKGGYVGVDIFFVISGFLITGLLLREIEATGHVSLLDFYARRAKRLLPASCLVLLFTAVAVYYFAPVSDQIVFGLDIAAAAAYFVNFRFSERSVDYLAEDIGRSPVLHFWSLSVEEQFYFIWPVLLLGALTLAKRTRWNLRGCASALLLVVFIPSLAWSVMHTPVEPSSSFFVTSTRLWELGLGALLAVGLPWVERLPKRWATPMAAAGWLLVLLAAGLFDASSVWPGSSALVPTVGTALIIGSGSIDAGTPLLRPLSSRIAVAVGGLSYSLYLWHWPLLVVGIDFLGFEWMGAGTLLVLLSVIPAYACHRFVENKIRFSETLAQRPSQALSMGFNFSLLALLVGLLFPLQHRDGGSVRTTVTLEAKAGRVIAQPAELGAGGLAKASAKKAKGWSKLSVDKITPEPVRAAKDSPTAYARGCQTRVENNRKIPWCQIGDPKGKIDVALLGDSKSLQYFDALDAVGKALGWKIKTATKSSCAFSAATGLDIMGRKYTACDKFNRQVLDALLKDPPDVVITNQAAQKGRLRKDTKYYTPKDMAKGVATYWSLLERRGSQIIVLLDNPHPPKDTHVYKCVAKNPNDYGKCSFSLKEGYLRSGAPIQLAAKKLFPKVNVVDLTKYICPYGKCSPVIDGVMVYRQKSHITNTYAKTLAPILTQELKKAAVKADPKLADRGRK
jgi:peptidoglycan/LPS O-acetylase OafA/YrhL